MSIGTGKFQMENPPATQAGLPFPTNQTQWMLIGISDHAFDGASVPYNLGGAIITQNTGQTAGTSNFPACWGPMLNNANYKVYIASQFGIDSGFKCALRTRTVTVDSSGLGYFVFGAFDNTFFTGTNTTANNPVTGTPTGNAFGIYVDFAHLPNYQFFVVQGGTLKIFDTGIPVVVNDDRYWRLDYDAVALNVTLFVGVKGNNNPPSLKQITTLPANFGTGVFMAAGVLTGFNTTGGNGSQSVATVYAEGY